MQTTPPPKSLPTAPAQNSEWLSSISPSCEWGPEGWAHRRYPVDFAKPNQKWERPSHRTDGKAEALQEKDSLGPTARDRGARHCTQISSISPPKALPCVILCTGHRDQLLDHGGTDRHKGAQFHKRCPAVEPAVPPASGESAPLLAFHCSPPPFYLLPATSSFLLCLNLIFINNNSGLVAPP